MKYLNITNKFNEIFKYNKINTLNQTKYVHINLFACKFNKIKLRVISIR